MTKIFYSLLFLFILLLVHACGYKKTQSGYLYNIKEARSFLFNDSYKVEDTIYITDYVLYSFDQNRMKNKIIISNEDSFLNLVKSGFQKLPLLWSMANENSNKSNEAFERNKLQRFNEIDTILIKEIANNSEYSKILIPVITFNYLNIGFASNHGDYLKYLKVSVFIIENNTIIYSSSFYHVEDVYSGSHPYNYKDYHIPIPQEHWDGLIKEVMKEYTERLK